MDVDERKNGEQQVILHRPRSGIAVKIAKAENDEEQSHPDSQPEYPFMALIGLTREERAKHVSCGHARHPWYERLPDRKHESRRRMEGSTHVQDGPEPSERSQALGLHP